MLPVETLRPEVSTQGAMPGSAGLDQQGARRDAVGRDIQVGNQHHRLVMLATGVAAPASLPDREA